MDNWGVKMYENNVKLQNDWKAKLDRMNREWTKDTRTEMYGPKCEQKIWAEVLKWKAKSWWAFSNSVLSHRWKYDEYYWTKAKCESTKNARSEEVCVTWRKAWQIVRSKMHNKNEEVDL